MKKFIAFLLVLLVGFTFVGCTNKQEDVNPTSIKIENAASEMFVGDKLTLNCKVLPSDANAEVVWKSSDDSIIAITGNGASVSIEALAVGSATITVTSKVDSNRKATIVIAVKENAVVTSIAFKDAPKSIVVDNMATLIVEFTPSNATDTQVKWESSDTATATVDGNGKVTALKEGSVTITATLTSNASIKVSTEINIVATGTTIDLLAIEGVEEMVVNNTFKLTAVGTPTDIEFTPVWTSSDEEIATVDENGNVSALKVGECTINCIAEGTEVSASHKVVVVNPPELTGIEITGAHDLETSEFCLLDIKTTPEYALYNVTWSTSDELIATIDELGKVTGIKEGTVIITASETTKGFEATATINVTTKFDPNAKPQQIIVTGPENGYVGYEYMYKAEVLPAGVNQNVIWKSSKPEVATIDETGKLTILSEGTTRISCVSVVDEELTSNRVSILCEIKIVEPTPDLGGYEIVIMNAESALKDLDPFLEAYGGVDRADKQIVWREIENKYNCTISVKAYPAEAPWGPTRIKWIQDNATNGTSQCDVAVLSAAWLCKLYPSLTDLTYAFGKYANNQIETSMKEASSYGGKMYAISYGLSKTKTYPIHGLFYNYGLVQKYQLDSPAQLFNDGLWTYDKFVEYCIAAQAILGENEFVVSGGPSLVWSGMVNSAGVKLADTVTMKLNLKHQYSYEAIAALQKIVEAGAWDIDNIGYDKDVAAFQSGRAIFQPGEYWFVRDSSRFPADVWGEGNTFYGYVPYPYPASVSKDQVRTNYMGESILTMPNGRPYPTGVTAIDIFRAVQDVYLLTIEKQNSNATFNPELEKENFITKRIDDPASITATVFFTSDKTLFDPLYDESFQYSWTGETTTAVINAIKGADPAEEFEAIYSVVDTKFKGTYGN